MQKVTPESSNLARDARGSYAFLAQNAPTAPNPSRHYTKAPIGAVNERTNQSCHRWCCLLLTTAFQLTHAVAQYFASACFELVKVREHFDETRGGQKPSPQYSGRGV